MQSGIGIGAVTPPADYVATLADTTGGQENFGADGIPGSFGTPHQLEREPVVPILYDIAQQDRRRVRVVQDHIDVAIVEQVAEGPLLAPGSRRQGRCQLRAGPPATWLRQGCEKAGEVSAQVVPQSRRSTDG